MNFNSVSYEDRWLTVPQAAKATGAGAHNIRKAIKDGLPTYHIGKSRVFVTLRDLREWASKHRHGTTGLAD
ncbi:MAG: helix-turn-helix domain-containing protein [Proteobacteria bacterium]|nr:helix-turn-helix domain-containing protein [Pseudomonadota bacterium]